MCNSINMCIYVHVHTCICIYINRERTSYFRAIPDFSKEKILYQCKATHPS